MKKPHVPVYLVLFSFLVLCCNNLGLGQTDKPADTTGSCGGEFQGEGGVIASPGFPGSATPNVNCTYEIEVDPGLVVAYQSTYFNLDDDCLVIFPSRNFSEGSGIQHCSNTPVPIDVSRGNKLTVVYRSGGKPGDGFAMSWYPLNVSTLPESFNCSFDGPLALCPGWMQSDLDQIDYSFRRDGTPSAGTGPSRDSSGSGRYAYVEASRRNDGDAAVLISPMITLNEFNAYCFSMMFHNRGINKATVEVLEVKDGNPTSLFTRNQETNDWVNANKTLYKTEQQIQIAIKASRGNGWRSDVGIDDIKILPRACEDDDTDTDFYDYGENNASYPDGGFIEDVYTEDNSTDNETDINTGVDQGCTDTDFRCSNLPEDCIPLSWLCDNNRDCSNGADENPFVCAANRSSAAVVTSSSTTPPSLCPSNLAYQSCARPCDHVCTDGYLAPACGVRCVQRCACPPELPVLHENRCILFDDCPQPELEAVTGLEVVELSFYDAVVSFNGSKAAENFKITIYPTKTPDQANVFVIPNDNKPPKIFYRITDLSSGTSYVVQVDSSRGDDEVSTEDLHFTTLRQTTSQAESTVIQTKPISTQTESSDTQTKPNVNQTESIFTQTQSISEKTETIDTKTELIGTQTELIDTQTELIDTQTELIDTQTEVVNIQTEAIITQTESIKAQTESVHTQTESIKAQTESILIQTDSSDSETKPSQTDSIATSFELVTIETQSIDTQTESIGRQTDTNASQTELFTSSTESINKQPELIDSQTEEIATQTSQIAAVTESFDSTTVEELVTLSSTKEQSTETAGSSSEVISLIEVDHRSVCVKITHLMESVTSYVVTLSDSSIRTLSDQSEEADALSPYTYACFYNLHPAREYFISIDGKRGTSIVGKRMNTRFTSTKKAATTPPPPNYQQTEETKQWKRSYKEWRINTLNKWYSTLLSYVKKVGPRLPSVAPDNSKCLSLYKPRCVDKPVLLTDYNGCLFFICKSFSTEGDVTEEDLREWEKEHDIFRNYLMPQWQDVFAAYSNVQEQQIHM